MTIICLTPIGTRMTSSHRIDSTKLIPHRCIVTHCPNCAQHWVMIDASRKNSYLLCPYRSSGKSPAFVPFWTSRGDWSKTVVSAFLTLPTSVRARAPFWVGQPTHPKRFFRLRSNNSNDGVKETHVSERLCTQLHNIKDAYPSHGTFS